MDNVMRDKNFKKELKGNARNQKHCDKIEECLWQFHHRLDTTEERNMNFYKCQRKLPKWKSK